MAPLHRWIEGEFNRRFPNATFVIGILATFPIMSFGPSVSTFGMSKNPQEATQQLLILGGVALLGWFPLIVRQRRHRHAPNFRALLSASRRGHLNQELGANASVLEEAAKDFEQIEALGRTFKPREIESAIQKEAFYRMRRAFDLSVSPPFRYGLTREDSPEQIRADAAFLAQARAALESLLVQKGTGERPGDEVLRELLREAQATRAAKEELRDSVEDRR